MYQRVTSQIANALEQGVNTWRMPWHTSGNSVGRQGNTDVLNLPAAGLEADTRGRLKVNDFFQTAVSHIYVAGDVIGFPALAATSMEQGRLATARTCLESQ